MGTCQPALRLDEACSTYQGKTLPEAGDRQANVAGRDQVLSQLRSDGNLQQQQRLIISSIRGAVEAKVL